MLSTVKGQFIKVVDLIPGLRSHRNAMPEPTPFKATDNLDHRYADSEVLRKALIEMGFKDEEIKIRRTEANGHDVELPRQLTKEQKNTIFEKFLEAKNAARAVPKTDDEEEDK
ncbi:hypothetical protein F5Y09DRAFT_294996 [Xylaria sp. FL1042]|nr:hypothetical protein F5Y09DRAFT_294996 [Xylaria sp. FL1042]